MWRNVSSLVAPAASLNNVVLPVWMLVFAVTMLATAHGRMVPALSLIGRRRYHAAKTDGIVAIK
jgi:hypothetical protein